MLAPNESYKLIKIIALSNFSGGTLGRLPHDFAEQHAVSVLFIAASASSAIRVIGRNG